MEEEGDTNVGREEEEVEGDIEESEEEGEEGERIGLEEEGEFVKKMLEPKLVAGGSGQTLGDGSHGVQELVSHMC